MLFLLAIVYSHPQTPPPFDMFSLLYILFAQNLDSSELHFS